MGRGPVGLAMTVILRKPRQSRQEARTAAFRSEALSVVRDFAKGLTPAESDLRRQAMAEALIEEMTAARGAYEAGMRLVVIGAKAVNEDWRIRSKSADRREAEGLAQKVFGGRAA